MPVPLFELYHFKGESVVVGAGTAGAAGVNAAESLHCAWHPDPPVHTVVLLGLGCW